MSILDTFFVIFKAETKDLSEGLDKAKEGLGDLGKAADRASQKTQGAMGGMISMAGKLAAAYGLVATARKAMSIAKHEAEAVEEMRKTQVAIGVAIDDMDAFTRAVEANGGSIGGATSALVGLYRSAGLAAQKSTGMQAQSFKALGVDIMGAGGKLKDSIELVHDLSAAVEGMDDASAMALLGRIGISDQRTIELIMKGRRELEDQQRVMRESGVLTERSVAIAQAYSDATTDLNTAMTSMRRVIMEMVTPALSWLTRQLTKIVEFATEHKGFAVSVILAISGALTAALIPSVLALLKTMAPLAPVALAIAAIGTAIGFVVDDIIMWKEGNESLIGELIEKYPWVAELVENIEAAFRGLLEIGPYLWDSYVNLGTKLGEGFAKALFAVKDFFAFLFGWISEKGQQVLDFFSAIGAGIGKIFQGNKHQVAVELAAAGEIDAIAKASPFVGGTPWGPMTSSAISNSTRQSSEVNIGELVIETRATDAKGIAGAARSELQGQLMGLRHATASGWQR